jgi:hypothetical protein
MYFHTGFIETILFKPWTTTSIPCNIFQVNLFDRFALIFLVFIESWIFIFILSILYEGIRELRQCFEKERLLQTSMLV